MGNLKITSVVTGLIIILWVIIMLLFVILLDRKMLGSIQGREGPVVSGIFGFLQAPVDGMKIFFKTIIFNRFTNKFTFFFCPLAAFFIGMLYWTFLPTISLGGVLDLTYDILVAYTLMSLGLVMFVLAAWSAFSSKFPIWGAVRELVQMLAYELWTGFVFLALVLFSGGMSFRNLISSQLGVWFFFLITPFAIIFFIVIWAELHRTPFDLSEAEAELTAGYQTEHGGSAFSAFYLAEYNNVLVFSSIFVISFLGGWAKPFLLKGESKYGLPFKVCFIIFLCIAVRGAMPRTRLSAFLNTAWSSLLPSSTNLFIFYLWVCFIFRLTYPSEYLTGVGESRFIYFFTSALIFVAVDGLKGWIHQKPSDPVALAYGRASMQKFSVLPGSDSTNSALSEDFGVRATNTGYMHENSVWPVSHDYYPEEANEMFWSTKRILNNRISNYTRYGYNGDKLIRPDISMLHPTSRHPSTSFPAEVMESAAAVNEELIVTAQNANMESIFNLANRDMWRSAELASPDSATLLADSYYAADYFGFFNELPWAKESYAMGNEAEILDTYATLADYISGIYEESATDPTYEKYLDQFHFQPARPEEQLY